MSKELAERETLISNILFFQMKLNKRNVVTGERLNQYSAGALQRLHDVLAHEFKGSEHDKTDGPAKVIYDKMIKEVNSMKERRGKLSSMAETVEWTNRFNFLVDVAELFGDELREAGYEPALKEALSTL